MIFQVSPLVKSPFAYRVLPHEKCIKYHPKTRAIDRARGVRAKNVAGIAKRFTRAIVAVQQNQCKKPKIFAKT